MSSPTFRLERVIAALIAVAALAAVAASAGSASARDKAAVVKGGGRGILIDPDGNEFRLASSV